jgi:hypothetical protein
LSGYPSFDEHIVDLGGDGVFAGRIRVSSGAVREGDWENE